MNVTRRLMRLLPAVVVSAGLLLLAAACGSSAQPSANSTGSQSGSASATSAAATPSAPPAKLTVSYVGVANEAPLWIAKESGIFQKHGLDVDLQQIPGPNGVAALASGQTQAFSGGGSETLNAAANGAEISLLAVLVPVFPFKLYAQNRIKTAADLKGKKVGITSPGGSYDTALRQALPTLGIQPDKDATFIATGSVANVTTAMISGAIDAAAVQIGPDSLKVDASNCCHVLFDFASVNVPNAQSVLAMQRAYVAAHKDVAQRFIDSYIEANAQEKRDKPGSLEVLKKYLKLDDQQVLSATYDYYTQNTVQVPLPLPKPDQFTTYLDQLAQKNEKVKGYDITKLIDPTFVQNAADRGLGK